MHRVANFGDIIKIGTIFIKTTIKNCKKVKKKKKEKEKRKIKIMY